MLHYLIYVGVFVLGLAVPIRRRRRWTSKPRYQVMMGAWYDNNGKQIENHASVFVKDTKLGKTVSEGAVDTSKDGWEFKLADLMAEMSRKCETLEAYHALSA